MTPVTLSTRNASLSDLAHILQDQQAAKHDIVVPATKLSSVNGQFVISGDGIYRPTAVADEGISEKLGIPLAYVRKLRDSRVDLYDANVNGWLNGSPSTFDDAEFIEGSGADARSFLVRTFRGSEGTEGVARALLSQNYRVIDNFDTLTAALDGIRQAGVNVQIVGCDLTERRMTVKVVCPEIAAYAPNLLRGYRSPFTGNGHGQAGLARIGRGNEFSTQINEAAEAAGYVGDLPLVFAGFIISNSETGGGAFTITPRLVVQVCTNGMTVAKDALRSIHLGSKMDDGVIRWSDATVSKNLELVTSQAKDAVTTFLDVEYVTSVVADIEAKASTPIADPNKQIEEVGKALRFTDDKIRDTLNAFILGGQPTAGGLLNAVTAVAQTIEDADDANAFEADALRVLDLAVA